MRYAKVFLIIFLATALLPGTVFAQSQSNALKKQQANADLDNMAKEIATLLQHPGFRGFLRSEIARSRNRENILELDKFLERSSKQKGMPPGLTKVKDLAGKAHGRLKASGLTALEGYDLYIPVAAHRSKWRGGKDFLVAFAPVDDEKDIKQIVAYSVNDGKRVILDPNRPPETVVLTLVPEEHETHIVETEPKAPGPPPKQQEIPPGKDFKSQKYGSILGMSYLKIKRDGESWTKGDPEVYVMAGQIINGQPRGYYWNLGFVNDTNKWYYVGDKIKIAFDSTSSYETYFAVWESDGYIPYEYRFGGWNSNCEYIYARLLCNPSQNCTAKTLKMCAHKSDDEIHVAGRAGSPSWAMVLKSVMPWDTTIYYHSGEPYWSDTRYAEAYFRMWH